MAQGMVEILKGHGCAQMVPANEQHSAVSIKLFIKINVC